MTSVADTLFRVCKTLQSILWLVRFYIILDAIDVLASIPFRNRSLDSIQFIDRFELNRQKLLETVLGISVNWLQLRSEFFKVERIKLNRILFCAINGLIWFELVKIYKNTLLIWIELTVMFYDVWIKLNWIDVFVNSVWVELS